MSTSSSPSPRLKLIIEITRRQDEPLPGLPTRDTPGHPSLTPAHRGVRRRISPSDADLSPSSSPSSCPARPSGPTSTRSSPPGRRPCASTDYKTSDKPRAATSALSLRGVRPRRRHKRTPRRPPAHGGGGGCVGGRWGLMSRGCVGVGRIPCTCRCRRLRGKTWGGGGAWLVWARGSWCVRSWVAGARELVRGLEHAVLYCGS